ncbi:hypothetical protein UA75_24540 [Actinoalloteichus sp. GBA129-24]|nr:hypothetical protein UA75_24540 [Actinoalloteichus sp. GBA129-24]
MTGDLELSEVSILITLTIDIRQTATGVIYLHADTGGPIFFGSPDAGVKKPTAVQHSFWSEASSNGDIVWNQLTYLQCRCVLRIGDRRSQRVIVCR